MLRFGLNQAVVRRSIRHLFSELFRDFAAGNIGLVAGMVQVKGKTGRVGDKETRRKTKAHRFTGGPLTSFQSSIVNQPIGNSKARLRPSSPSSFANLLHEVALAVVEFLPSVWPARALLQLTHQPLVEVAVLLVLTWG